MAPKAMSYKANSVIYFKGDVSEKIYILKGGKVSLTSEDIETGQEVRDFIQTGEFFGVKSALGRYPREESALVLGDADVVQFTVPEFEQFVALNTRVIMKMLKVFSNQLRRIHVRVQNLLSMEEKSDPEAGLFSIGEYYLKKRMYPQAVYAFRQYLTYYPSGKYSTEAANNRTTAEQYSQRYGSGKGPVPGTPAAAAVSAAPPASKPASPELSGTAKMYYNAVSLFSQNNFTDAMKEFKKIADAAADEEYTVKSLYEIGRCYFALNPHDPCIKHFTGLVQRYPKMPDLPDALYYVGQSYEAKGDTDRAAGFYRKILSMTSEGDQIQRKVRKSLRALEERKA